MATITPVDVGAAPNDGNGDPLRTAFQKINTNEANLNSDKSEVGHTHTLADVTDSGALAALNEVDSAEIATDAVGEDELATPSNATRLDFQQYPDAPAQFTNDFTFNEATDAGRLIQLNPNANTVKMTLPDASGLTRQDGWLCDVRVASGAFACSVDVAVTGQMGVQTGYSITNFDPEADEQFFGLNQATALNNVYSLYKRGSVYQWQAGFFRNAAIDDLTFDGPLHGGGGIPATILDAKGDLIGATAADTAARLAVGANGTVLKANSVTSTGLEWAAEAGGSSFFVNVEDSGAVGDGVTDDTTDIQTALDAAVGKCLVFPRRGPWRCAGELRIKGNCTVLGLGGAKIEYEGADGCMGVNSAAFEYLKVSGLTFEYTGGATGNVERIAFATTNDLTKQSFDGGASVEIDMMILEDCHFIRSKVLLNSGGNNQIICRHNRFTTPNATVKMTPYYLMVRFGDENDQGGVVEDRGGALIHHNTLIVHPSTADPANTDIVKITGGLTKVDFHDNWIENLTPATTSGQVDVYTGGGQSNIHHNTWIDTSLHFKQYGPTPGWQDISVWSQSNINHNFWHFKTNSQGNSNACIFHRASALTNINNNQFKITATAQTYAIYLDNAEVAEDSGLGTNAPYAITISTNTYWAENNNTHRFLNADPASFGDTEYLNLHGNMVLCPAGQSTTVCNAGSTDNMSITGNTMINGNSIQAGASFEEAANIGVSVV